MTQISELNTVSFDLWINLGYARWPKILFDCWIASSLTLASWPSLLLLAVSRGRRENIWSTLDSRVTATISCSSFLLVEVSLISRNLSTFCPKISNIWCLFWLLMEVRVSCDCEILQQETRNIRDGFRHIQHVRPNRGPHKKGSPQEDRLPGKLEKSMFEFSIFKHTNS